MKQVKIAGKIVKRGGKIVKTTVLASYMDSIMFSAGWGKDPIPS